MIQLLFKINALYQFYKAAHWLAKGELFYQDHLLFEKLYEGLDDEMDALVELMSAYNLLGEFNSRIFAEETAKLTPESKDNEANMHIAAKLETDIVATIEKLNESKIPVGLFNHIAGIAQNHTRSMYLLERAIMR